VIDQSGTRPRRRLSSRALAALARWGAYIHLAARRLRYSPGVSLSALAGMTAVLSLVVCIPAFSYSVSGQVLQAELLKKNQETGRALFSLHTYYLDKNAVDPFTLAKASAMANYLNQNASRLVGLPVVSTMYETQSNSLQWRYAPGQPAFETLEGEPYFDASFFWMKGLEERARITEGAWPAPVSEPNQPVQVAIQEETANERLINVGDRFQSGGMEIVISGLWEADDPYDPYFYERPGSAYSSLLYVPEETYDRRIEPEMERPLFYTAWYVVFDDSHLDYRQAPAYTRGLTRLNANLRALIPMLDTDYTPLDQLTAYMDRAETLSGLFLVIGAPAVVLLLLFIGLVAGIAAADKDRETAVLRGRGSTRGQVIGLALAEVLILLALALPISLALGWLEAGLVARTLSFLSFSILPRVPVSLQGINPLWLAGACTVMVIAWLLPVRNMARASIVRVKQERARTATKPLWERAYLDLLFLLPGIYVYFTFKPQTDSAALTHAAAEAAAASAVHYRDPFLFAAPALFSIGLCMLALRVLPLLTALIAGVVDHLSAVWAYLSLKQIARRPSDHLGALLLIMISLSLAIYSASLAKTLDLWLVDSLYYRTGADLVVHEYSLDVKESSILTPSSGRGELTITDLDLNIGSYATVEDHLKLPGVRGVTRVGKYEGTYSDGSGEEPCILVGIDRIDFSKVGFYREDFSPQPVDVLMNELGLEPQGVLISSSLAQQNGYQVGDRLLVSAQIQEEKVENDLVIVGLYDFFPTVEPGDLPALIVNLDSLFANPDSALGYDLWLRLDDQADINQVITDARKMVGGSGVEVQAQASGLEDLRESLEQPERVGMFGVLNVGFLVTGVLPAIGFVLYSYASLRRRFIQLGILRAVGFSVKQMMGYLAFEQLFLMFLAVGLGAGVGLLTSAVFLPYMQAGVGQGALPFLVKIGWLEAVGLSVGFFVVLAITVAGMISYLAQSRVFQAIKMGDGE
jgi:putative ABC transport system permease protein